MFLYQSDKGIYYNLTKMLDSILNKTEYMVAYERLYILAFGKETFTADENIEIEHLKELIAVYQKKHKSS